MSINAINTRILSTEFEYFEPSSVEEAVNLLGRYKEQSAVLSGGTDLLVRIKQKRIEPRYLVNIKRIDALRRIEKTPELLRIGAATSLLEIEQHDFVRSDLQALHEAVSSIGSMQIRNMATLGGNISRASPAGDSPPPLLVLGARVNLRETTGTRSIPIEEFFKGPGRTIMKPSELFVSLEIPNPPKASGTAFLKVARTGMDLAKVNAASMIMVEDNVVQSCRVALGGVAPTPIRVKKAEELLIGEKPTDARFADAAKTASDEVRPIASSHRHKRSTAQYRINVSGALVKRTLQLARDRSLGRK